MIDIRDRDGIVAGLRDAQRRSERGAPVPIAGRELLRELADALADTGPRELGVTSEKWLNAVRAAEVGVASADSARSSKMMRRTKRSIRELERFFSRKDTRRRTFFTTISFVVAIGFSTAIVVGSHDTLRAAGWIVAVIAALAVLVFLIGRYEPNVKQAVTWLDLPDRQLFAHSVKASPSELKSFARAKLGMYVHPVLIATDRRLLLARPRDEVPGRPGSDKFGLAWEIPYRDIMTFSSRTTGGETPATLISVHSPEREIKYQFPCADGKALVAILKRRAPEAFTESAASCVPWSRALRRSLPADSDSPPS
jgi:hypothetical protein